MQVSKVISNPSLGRKVSIIPACPGLKILVAKFLTLQYLDPILVSLRVARSYWPSILVTLVTNSRQSLHRNRTFCPLFCDQFWGANWVFIALIIQTVSDRTHKTYLVSSVHRKSVNCRDTTKPYLHLKPCQPFNTMNLF